MKKLYILIIIPAFFLATGCKKDDETRDQFYYGEWDITEVRVGFGNMNNAQLFSVDYGTIEFKGYQKKAKRGSFRHKISGTWAGQAESYESEGGFIWWIQNSNDAPTLFINADRTDEKVLGVGPLSYAALDMIDVVDKDHIKITVHMDTSPPQKGYMFELKRR